LVCNTLQHTATHCNTLQHTATHCNTSSCLNTTPHLWGDHSMRDIRLLTCTAAAMQYTSYWSAIHCNTLQHTLMPQYDITSVRRPLHTVCDMHIVMCTAAALHYTSSCPATHCNTLWCPNTTSHLWGDHSMRDIRILTCTAAAMQYTSSWSATHCNILQHTLISQHDIIFKRWPLHTWHAYSNVDRSGTAIYIKLVCNTLQHTATHRHTTPRHHIYEVTPLYLTCVL